MESVLLQSNLKYMKNEICLFIYYQSRFQVRLKKEEGRRYTSLKIPIIAGSADSTWQSAPYPELRGPAERARYL